LPSLQAAVLLTCPVVALFVYSQDDAFAPEVSPASLAELDPGGFWVLLSPAMNWLEAVVLNHSSML
jgi:hypothetical protein